METDRMTSATYRLSFACRLTGVALLAFCWVASTAQLSAADFDVVIVGGRVIDPESKLDAVRNVGIQSGKIEALTTRLIKGRTTVDGSGLYVAYGFIDQNEPVQVHVQLLWYACMAVM